MTHWPRAEWPDVVIFRQEMVTILGQVSANLQIFWVISAILLKIRLFYAKILILAFLGNFWLPMARQSGSSGLGICTIIECAWNKSQKMHFYLTLLHKECHFSYLLLLAWKHEKVHKSFSSTQQHICVLLAARYLPFPMANVWQPCVNIFIIQRERLFKLCCWWWMLKIWIKKSLQNLLKIDALKKALNIEEPFLFLRIINVAHLNDKFLEEKVTLYAVFMSGTFRDPHKLMISNKSFCENVAAFVLWKETFVQPRFELQKLNLLRFRQYFSVSTHKMLTEAPNIRIFKNFNIEL